MSQQNSEMPSQLHQMNSQEPEVKSIAVADGISELQEMQTRIKAVEKAFVEEIERLVVQESMKNSIKVEDQISETEDSKLRSTSCQGEANQKEEIELQGKLTDNSKPENSEVSSRTLMKDIPLDQVSDYSFYGKRRGENTGSNDQMLGLWECAEQDCGPDPMVHDQQKRAAAPAANTSVRSQSKAVESKNPFSELEIEKELGVDKLEVSSSNGDTNKEGSKRKILERLASDAQKLTSLQTTVQDLKNKMEMNKSKKAANDPEYEQVKRQLKEVEETVVELVGINDQLTKDTEQIPSFDGKSAAELEDAGRKLAEQAQEGSEKIGRLQLAVQSIRYILLKLEDESKTEGKQKFSGSRTGALWRDFIYSGGRSSTGRRKGCLCGCMRPSTNGD